MTFLCEPDIGVSPLALSMSFSQMYFFQFTAIKATSKCGHMTPCVFDHTAVTNSTPGGE